MLRLQLGKLPIAASRPGRRADLEEWMRAKKIVFLEEWCHIVSLLLKG